MIEACTGRGGIHVRCRVRTTWLSQPNGPPFDYRRAHHDHHRPVHLRLTLRGEMANVVGVIYSAARQLIFLLKSIAGQDSAATSDFVVLQHTPRLVVYQGSDTHVAVTLFAIQHAGQRPSALDNSSLDIQLVQRGWRAGLLGWSIAKWLGAKTVKGIDVTPTVSHHWAALGAPEAGAGSEAGASVAAAGGHVASSARTSFPERTLEKWSKHAARFAAAQAQAHYVDLPGRKPIEKLLPLATYAVRIPARAGDGYFRLSVRSGHGPYAVSPDFRVYSLSLTSASPRGAALLPPTIAPELLLRTLSTMLYTFLLGLFPVAAILEKVLPRGSARKVLSWIYRKAGLERKADELMQQYNVQDRVDHARVSVLETVPFASAGIRTEHDLQKDEGLGRGGVSYVR